MIYQRTLLTIVLGVLVPPAVAQEQNVAGSTLELLRNRVFKEQRTRGLAVGIINSEDSQIYLLGDQAEAGPKVSLDTVFEIGSISKVFTGIVLGALDREQTLRIDDPILIGLPPSLSIEGVKHSPPSLRDLVSHRSGFPRLPFNLRAFASDPYADYGVSELWAGVEKVKLLGERPRRFEYSNFGSGLLGTLMERRSGKSLEALLRRYIWQPIGMSHTSFRDPPPSVFAAGHDVNLRVRDHWHFRSLAAAGGLRSTLPDMMKFLRANLGLAALDNESMAILDLAQTEPSDGGRVALGWHLDRRTDGTIIWHNGGTGGFASFLGFDRAKGHGVVILSNSNADVTELGFHLLDRTLPLRRYPHLQLKEVPRPHRKELVGDYALRDDFVMNVDIAGRGLSVQATGQPRFRLFPVTPDRWASKTVPAVLEFKRDDRGSVKGVTLHQGGRSQFAARRTP